MMDVYASESQYVQGPTGEQQAKGTIPLDTLPADWWNWLWKSITERINQASTGMESLYEEILSVLTAASIEPSQLQSDQLLNAIRALARITGTSSVAGAVKSSTGSGKVSIDENGIMTVNGLGVPSSLNTVAKNVVNAINEVLSAYTSNKTTTDASITGLQNSKAPTNHASAETTYGKGTSSTYGHVKLYDGVDSASGSNGGTAATPAAVKTVNDELQVVKATLAIPVGLVTAYAGATPPEGWLLCVGQQVAKASYPALYNTIGTTYNLSTDAPDAQSLVFRLPDLRETVPVGIGERGSGTSRHDTFTLGQFKDDTYQSHSHTIDNGGVDHYHTIYESGADHTHGGTTNNGGVNHVHYFSWEGSHTHTGITDGTHVYGANDGVMMSGYQPGWLWGLRGNIGASLITGEASITVQGNTQGASAVEHAHNFTTDTASANHAHTFTTGTASANHYHDFTTDTASANHSHGMGGSTAYLHNHNAQASGSTVTKGKSLGMNYIIKA